MSNRIALIFDTNFIIEHSKDLENVVKKLSETYEVFVTQLSIDERISQQYLDLKANYDKVDKLATEIKSFAKVDVLVDFEKCFESRKRGIQNNYDTLFSGKIIPFSRSQETFSEIIDRVNKKTAPFIKGSSDKGFKDTILWLSLIDYFSKNLDFQSVLFVSNDHGFTENVDTLKTEFKSKTSLTINIENNDFLNKIVQEEKKIDINSNGIANIKSEELKELRQDVQKVLSEICTGTSYNPYEDGYRTYPLFKLTSYLEVNQIEDMLNNLQNLLFRNLFATQFLFSSLFPNLYIFKEEYYIPRDDIESLNNLHDKIKSNYKQVLPQFYKAVTELINRNYDSSGFPEDIPF